MATLRRTDPIKISRGWAKRRRRFNAHAKRWRYGQRAERPGQLVQIDHMSLSRDSKQLKEFKAVSPIGKQLVTRVHCRATANNAKRFPEAVRTDLPHKLISVHDDGAEPKALRVYKLRR